MRPRRPIWAALALAAACHSARPALPPAPALHAAARPDTGAAQSPDTARSPDSTTVAQRDVTREALDIFGDTLAVPGRDSAALDSAAADSAPTWDIDVHSYETHQRVEYFVDRYQHAAHDRFLQWLDRGGRYEKMIRAKLHAAGLPEDLTYLALIESGYDPDAYSHAAAVGIWQFMASTARGTGLRVDWWIDERRDPVRATDGAVKFLGWLNEQFGSLYLAAAAYNGGPGRVSRGLTRYADELEGQSGNDAFFALAQKDYFKAETRDYVPRLIAAALIAKDPARYGFEPTYAPELAYDSVRVGPGTPLAAVAMAAGVPVDTIVALNPEVLRGMTPPSGSYVVRVPPGTAAGFDSAFTALPRDARVAYTRTVTRRREGLAVLASHADLSVKQLRWYNPKLRTDRHGRVAAGAAVLIPSRPVVRAARDVPDPDIERYGSFGGSTTHVVRRGESLGLIAKHYHTTVRALMRVNGMRKSMIFPGQVIVIRGAPHRSRRSPHQVRAAARRTHAASGARVHLVRAGETLDSIARDYDTTVKAIKALNDLQGDRVRTGQKVRIPG